MSIGCDKGLVVALSVVVHLIVYDTKFEIFRIVSNGQVETGTLQQREQKHEQHATAITSQTNVLADPTLVSK